MSTFETDRLIVGGACPCGQGKIIFSVTPQDMAWSSENSHPVIDCLSCKLEWTITAPGLVNIETQRLYESACIEQLARREELIAFTSNLMEGYFRKFAAAKKFAEWNDIQRVGMYRGLFEDFLMNRKHELASQIAQSPQNADFLRKLATEAAQIERLTLLLDAFHRASTAAEEAYDGILRRKLPETVSPLVEHDVSACPPLP